MELEGGGDSARSAASDVTPLTPSSSAKGSGCGQLFSVLMDLPVPPWVSSDKMSEVLYNNKYRSKF